MQLVEKPFTFIVSFPLLNVEQSHVVCVWEKNKYVEHIEICRMEWGIYSMNNSADWNFPESIPNPIGLDNIELSDKWRTTLDSNSVHFHFFDNIMNDA